jgi:hypothetical protein
VAQQTICHEAYGLLPVWVIHPMRFRRLPAVIALLLCAFSASAQDVLTIGNASGPSGASIAVPISILDRSGTSLGIDASASNRIQGFAFKVMFDDDAVSSVTFTRVGIAASATPLFETKLLGDGWISVVVTFSQPLALDLNTTAPGNRIGMLTVVANGTTTLRFDPPSAVLSNQAGTVQESVGAGNLALNNGSVTIGAAPTNLVATAIGTSPVNLTWTALGGATSYEVWRSFNGGAFTLIATPSAPSFSDSSVGPNTTYLYQVRANTSAVFSNVDAATTIVFTDDPLVAQSTIVKLVHMTQLRTASSAMRLSAGLPSMSADVTIGAGLPVRATHITSLRTALNEARAAIGLPALTFTDATLTTIKAAHVQELRNGVK